MTTTKRIAIQTWGSTGDVNPFIALAAGLAKAGHQVTLAITSTERTDYSEQGKRLGFEVQQVGYIGRDVPSLNQFGKELFAEKNPLRQMRMIFDDMFTPGAEAMYQAARKLCKDHELIIGHFIAHPVQLAAEQAGRPYITVSLHHGTIPGAYTAPYPLPNLGRWLNPWLWRLVEATINRIALPSVNAFRARYDAPAVSSIRRVWESPLCNLIAVSPQLCRPQPDWQENQKVCGFFNLPDSAKDWQPPEQLAAFLAAGSAPVYITFGSMMGLAQPGEELDATIRLWLAAVKQAGCRAIIQTHWHAASAIEEDRDIYRIESAVHTAVFPLCAAVVHHGGAGTTQTAMLCGCPSVVVAHIADQFFWGDQLRLLGIAPRFIKRHQLTVHRLAKALRQVLRQPAMKTRAEEVGKALRAENGVDRAVAFIAETGSS